MLNKHTHLLSIFTDPHWRELLKHLVRRELTQRYKQSVLGYFWVILAPAAKMGVMSFFLQYVFARPASGVPYPIYLFCGVLVWDLFAQSLTACTNSLVANASLIKQIYFPREVLIASDIAAKIVDFALSSVVFVAMMIFYRLQVSWFICWLPVILLIQIIFTYALGLFLAAANLFYRDIQFLWNLVVLLWMYCTPVLYSTENFPASVAWVFKINPLAILINAYRQVILAGGQPNLLSLALALLLSVVLLISSFAFFKKHEGKFADV